MNETLFMVALVATPYLPHILNALALCLAVSLIIYLRKER